MKNPCSRVSILVFIASLATFICFCADSSTSAMAAAPQTDAPGTVLVYIGSYADEHDEGISLYQLDMHSGQLSRIDGFAGVKNPSFQALHPTRKFLYTVGESSDFDDRHGGSVARLPSIQRLASCVC